MTNKQAFKLYNRILAKICRAYELVPAEDKAMSKAVGQAMLKCAKVLDKLVGNLPTGGHP